MPRLLIPLPSVDFEPTEAAVPWRSAKSVGIEVVFATPDGEPARCDPLALEGVVFGQIGARREDAALYRRMEDDDAFCSPIRYEDVEVADFAALHLPGGHAPGMRPYLEDETLQRVAAKFCERDKIVSAICHGPVLLARAQDSSGRSLLHGRRLTALTKRLERSAYVLTMWTLGRHFRTYPQYVEDEVRQALGATGTFERGPLIPSYANGFIVRDGNLITARWPGDAKRLGQELAKMILERPALDATASHAGSPGVT